MDLKNHSFNKSVFGGLMILSLYLIPGSLAQSESLQIAYIGVGKIRDGYREYQLALAELKKVKESEQQNIDKMSGDFDSSVKQFEQKSGLFNSDDAKQEEMQTLQKKYSIISGYKEEKDAELFEKTKKTLDPLVEKIRLAIEEVARAAGYHLVFKESSLEYADPRLDISDKVVELLNKTYPVSEVPVAQPAPAEKQP